MDPLTFPGISGVVSTSTTGTDRCAPEDDGRTASVPLRIDRIYTDRVGRSRTRFESTALVYVTV